MYRTLASMLAALALTALSAVPAGATGSFTLAEKETFGSVPSCGSAALDTIWFVANPGFAGTVTLYIAVPPEGPGLPAGVTAAFDPPVLSPSPSPGPGGSPGQTSTLTVSATGAAPGIYLFQIGALDGSGNRATNPTVGFYLSVAPGGCGPADAPIQAFPGRDLTGVEGMAVSGLLATVTDGAGAGSSPADLSATVSWGDLTPPDNGTITGSSGQYAVFGSHSYAEEGLFLVTVTIHDRGGAADAVATIHARIADARLAPGACHAPSAVAGAYSLAATFTDGAGAASDPRDISAVISWGDSVSTPGALTPDGAGGYSVSGSHTYSSTGSFNVTVDIFDRGGQSASLACPVIVFAFPSGGGAFVIGDRSSAPNARATFWGAQWADLNSLSGGPAPAAFKGFAPGPIAPACGSNWTSRPGNSSGPPPGPLPALMGVLVAGHVTRSGAVVSGDALHIAIVSTDPGYEPNPGHPGTGTIVALLC